MDKYFILRSTDSTEYYPGNQSWSFRVHLDEPLHLERKWRVSLVDITFENWTTNKRSDCRDIYVYSSLCESVHGVGETKSPLLRRLCLRGAKRERSFEFIHRHYLPVRVQDTDTVHLYIKDASGEHSSFISGTVIATLHLKPLPFWS